MSIQDIVKLSELLGEMGNVMRATHLPNGKPEPDSHHSFSLALIAYHIVVTECPELDASKVMLFALAHDLLEIITGDEDTLHYTPEQHVAKQVRESEAILEFDKVFANYPELKNAMHDYEKLDTPEAATVFVLDKACTTWTWLHHPDLENHSAIRGIKTRADIERWMDRQREKLANRLKVQPPTEIMNVYTESFNAMKELYEV